MGRIQLPAVVGVRSRSPSGYLLGSSEALTAPLLVLVPWPLMWPFHTGQPALQGQQESLSDFQTLF